VCGIAGIFNPNGLNDLKESSSPIREMVSALYHRGPDEQGVLISNIAHIGHARLSIVDIENGQQPMLSENNRFAITYNGEIYNHFELRNALLKKGYRFKTKCDTEVLLYLYQEYQEKCVPMLNGQFAFAIIDFYESTLFIARDRIGIRPLFYTLNKNNFYFASSIKSILQNKEIPNDFNYNAYYQLISLWSPIADNTFFKSIKSLEPGHAIKLTSHGIEKNTYWDIDFPDISENRSLEEWSEIVKKALSESVKLRLRADVPISAYLSGGLDSCIILDLVKRYHRYPVKSFSITFDNALFDESEYQIKMAKHLSCPNYAEQMSNEKIADGFDSVIEHSEQPIYRTAPVPLYYLSSSVQGKNYKVVLTGEGADEIALGYNIFKETLIRSKLSMNPNSKKWQDRIPLLYPYLKQYNSKYINFLKEFYLRSITDPDCHLFSHQIRISNGKSVLNYLTKDLKNEFQTNNIYESSLRDWLPRKMDNYSHLQKAQYIEMKTLLSGYLLSSQGDRMSMAHSVESRYPFLDHNVIELFAKIPEEIKLRKMNEKFILKKAFEENLPKDITERKKQPYRAPEAHALINNNKIERYLNKEKICSQEFFDWNMLNKLSTKIKKDPDNVSFNENFTFVNAIATTIFLSKDWRKNYQKNKIRFRITRV